MKHPEDNSEIDARCKTCGAPIRYGELCKDHRKQPPESTNRTLVRFEHTTKDLGDLFLPCVSDSSPEKHGASCTWTPDDDGTFETGCGQLFVFIDGGPKDNGFKFCCYCGKEIKEGDST